MQENFMFFVSHWGKEYSCNPKYLFEYIYKNYGNLYQYIWCINNKKIFPNEYRNIIFVKYYSIKYIWYVLRSKYYICNFRFDTVFPGRKGQIVINTWHGGGAYKKHDAFMPAKEKIRNYSLIMRKIRAKQISYGIASCEKFKVCMAKEWDIPEEKFLPIGMPRNDIFFSIGSFKEKIKNYYNMDKKKKIILYAPTFRSNGGRFEAFSFSLKTEQLLETMKIKFKEEFVLLYRGHRYYSFDSIPTELIDVSSYPDMQELLSAVDILITDYSSSMWDFSLTYKPCYIYAPDAEKYKEKQGFYTPIEDWPFPFAQTNEQLMENILKFDEDKYKQAVKKHHIDLGSYENGTACEQFCRIFTINN